MTAPWIQSRSGLKVDLEAPKPDQIDIVDIAYSLSKLCRFTGHTARDFYSVAYHSILVSRLCPDEYKLTGLLHDGAEAYLGDVSSPLKRLLPAYRNLELNFNMLIATKFGLTLIGGDWPGVVKRADSIMLATEKRDLMCLEPEPWPAAEPPMALPIWSGIDTSLDMDGVAKLFLGTYYNLIGR